METPREAQSDNSLEALKKSLDTARIAFGVLYRKTLIEQNKSRFGNVVTFERIASKKHKNKKGPGEAPARIVDESKVSEEYTKARDAYDAALDAYFSALGERMDAASLIDAYDAENKLLANEFEVDRVSRFINERRVGAAKFASRIIKSTRLDKLAAFAQRKFKESPLLSRVVATFGAAGVAFLAVLFPPLIPYVLGFTAGFTTRWLTKVTWKNLGTWWREGVKFNEAEASLAESWNEARKRGLSFRQWHEENLTRLKGRATIIRNSNRAGLAVGIGVGVGTFVGTGSSLGRNIAKEALGYTTADLSFVPSAQAAPRPDVDAPKESLDRGVPGLGKESAAREIFEYFSNELNRLTNPAAEKKFFDDIEYLKSLVGPEDDKFLDEIARAYRLNKGFALENLHRLSSGMDSASMDSIRMTGMELNRNTNVIKVWMQYVTDQAERARANPDYYRTHGIPRIRLSEVAGEGAVQLASADAGQPEYEQAALSEPKQPRAPHLPIDGEPLTAESVQSSRKIVRSYISWAKQLLDSYKMDYAEYDDATSRLESAQKIKAFENAIKELEALDRDLASAEQRIRALAAQRNKFIRGGIATDIFDRWFKNDEVPKLKLSRYGTSADFLHHMADDMSRLPDKGFVMSDGVPKKIDDIWGVDFKNTRESFIPKRLARAVVDFYYILQNNGLLKDAGFEITEGFDENGKVSGEHKSSGHENGYSADVVFDTRTFPKEKIFKVLAATEGNPRMKVYYEAANPADKAAKIEYRTEQALKAGMFTSEAEARAWATSRIRYFSWFKGNGHFHIDAIGKVAPTLAFDGPPDVGRPKLAGPKLEQATFEPNDAAEVGFVEVASRSPQAYDPNLGKTPVTPQNAEVLKRIGNMAVSEINGIETYQEFLTQQKAKVAETLANYTLRLENLQKMAVTNPDLSSVDIEILKSAVVATSAQAGADVALGLNSVITGPYVEVTAEELRIKASKEMKSIWSGVIAISEQLKALERIANSGMPNVRPGTEGAISA